MVILSENLGCYTVAQYPLDKAGQMPRDSGVKCPTPDAKSFFVYFSFLLLGKLLDLSDSESEETAHKLYKTLTRMMWDFTFPPRYAHSDVNSKMSSNHRALRWVFLNFY